jgi:2Fe-2S ferredoxin
LIHPAKKGKNMPRITAIDKDGNQHDLSANIGAALMVPLRDNNLVDAICGGTASCGTCHVYLHDGWVKKAGERTEDEDFMLEALEDVVEVRPSSRLACQLVLTDELEGILLDIAPQL